MKQETRTTSRSKSTKELYLEAVLDHLVEKTVASGAALEELELYVPSEWFQTLLRITAGDTMSSARVFLCQSGKQEEWPVWASWAEVRQSQSHRAHSQDERGRMIEHVWMASIDDVAAWNGFSGPDFSTTVRLYNTYKKDGLSEHELLMLCEALVRP
jgi:hypothetical protein